MQLEILSQSDSNTLNGLIQAARNIVVCCHKSPDGDALRWRGPNTCDKWVRSPSSSFPMPFPISLNGCQALKG